MRYKPVKTLTFIQERNSDILEMANRVGELTNDGVHGQVEKILHDSLANKITEIQNQSQAINGGGAS